MSKPVSLNSIILIMLFASFGCNNNRGSNPADRNTPISDTTANNITPAEKKNIVFFGNSLTAGYGVEPSEAFPAVIQRRIDSLGLPYKVVNAGVSGETSSGGKGRIDWILQQPLDVFVLELGANDGLRGIPVAETKKNLQFIIDRVKAKYPSARIVLAGMMIPPNMGQQYAGQFRDIFPALATENKITLIPFLLRNVGGEERLNQQDGIHPTPEGHLIVAENVWDVLKGVL